MPNVNGMQFPYTPEGVAQSKQAAMRMGGSLNLDQNPFEAIFAQGQGQPAAAPATPTAQPAPAANGQAMPEQLVGPNEFQPGKTGDNTRPLLGAIQQLHNYIAASTDPGTIQLVRNLISALTQLVARDQEQSTQLAQQQTQQGGQGGQVQVEQAQQMPV